MQEGFLFFRRLMTIYFDFLHCFSSFIIYLDIKWTVYDRACLPFFPAKILSPTLYRVQFTFAASLLHYLPFMVPDLQIRKIAPRRVSSSI